MKTFTCGRSQAGASLIVSLIMLVVVTLLVLSAIRSGNINTRIAGNMQARQEARSAAEQAIEQFVSNYANFLPNPRATHTVNVAVNGDQASVGPHQIPVQISQPICKKASRRDDLCPNSVSSGLKCWSTLWEVTATATDSISGASQTVSQGFVAAAGPTFNPGDWGC